MLIVTLHQASRAHAPLRILLGNDPEPRSGAAAQFSEDDLATVQARNVDVTDGYSAQGL